MSAQSVGRLVLAALHLEPTRARDAELRRAATELDDWDAALAALEAHGILGLAQRNLARVAAPLPPPVAARLAQRAESMRALALGFRLTLERFLAEAARIGLRVTLLKGASLALDLYPRDGLRSQGDLDLLVAREDVPAAVGAARRIGLRRPVAALPVWWYRLAHFHLKLVPVDGLQRELELHWHLHPPTRLYALRLADLHARARTLELAGCRVWTLDPLDRLLHLVTHLARHAPVWGAGRATLADWAADPHAPLRLKWLLDIAAEIERRHLEFEPALLALRAAEWNAETELALTLAWLRTALELASEAEAWIVRALAVLPAQPTSAATPVRREHEAPLAGLDLRASALADLPRWVWPPPARLAQGGHDAGFLRRLKHAGGVLLRLVGLGLALPVAVLARAGEPAWSRLQPKVQLGPEDTLALAVRARELARGEDAATSS